MQNGQNFTVSSRLEVSDIHAHSTHLLSSGPIFTLKFLGQRIILLNSHKAVVDLLEKKKAVYAGRPENMIMASELSV